MPEYLTPRDAAREAESLESEKAILARLLEAFDAFLSATRDAIGDLNHPSEIESFLEMLESADADYLRAAFREINEKISEARSAEDTFYENQERSQTAFRQAGV